MSERIITRRNMWKPLAMILIGIAALSVTLTPRPTRAQPIMTIYQVHDFTGNVGDILPVDVIVYDAEDLWGWQVDMLWDPAVLGYVGHTFAGFLSGQPEGSTTVAFTDNVAYGNFMAAETTFGAYDGVTTASGLLITVRFELLALVTTTVDINTPYTYWMQDAATIWGDTAGEMIKENGDYIPPWPEDINTDGIVDAMDLAYVAINWGKSGGAIDPPEADISGDGYVDITDLSMVCLKYGQYAGY